MTKDLQDKLEGLCRTKVYQDDLIPALSQMRQENLEALSRDQEEKVSAFLRGRISVLAELINIEIELNRRNASQELREKKQREEQLNGRRSTEFSYREY